MSDQSGKVIRPPNTLSQKVTVGGPGAVDAAALERAESVIANLAGDYIDWAKEDIKRLESIFNDLKSGSGDADKAITDIFQISHDIKGQGGSFDFPLMTIIGGQLCAYIEKRKEAVDAGVLEVIGLHINALQLVISQNLTGDGGAVGDQLLTGLEKVIEKRS
ncbi:MAG: Hpt domain-containing protein [Rhodospirillales bacterium]|nr:Hpt domain-containing protein [Rhodospirillales bacterium]MDP6646683.1 Hpt domain-containing protein [Rhodospirillales bacterium]MDP6841777.1 Hpt domain-containing protein [Rhodospirillales bacterium]